MGLRSWIVSRLGRDVLAEAEQRAARAALAEATASSAIDPDEHLWRSLTRDPRRDLPEITHDRAIEVCFHLYRENPLGSRITELNRDFVVGDGITWSARHPGVEEIVREFWTDEVNDLDRRLGDFALELGLYGELIPEVFVGEVSGVVQLGMIDPSQVRAVIPAEMRTASGDRRPNPLVPDRIRVRGRGLGVGGKELRVIRSRDGRLDGDVFYFRVNAVSSSTRGWPDLLRIADWLDAYDQFLWDVLERASLMRTFIWDVTLVGIDQAKIDEWVRRYGTPPRSGSIRAHNDKVQWQAVSPSLGSHETAKDAEVLLEHLAAGAGYPKHWLSSAEDVNRATAAEMGLPTLRRLATRQRYFLACVHRMIRFVLERAVEAGRLRVDADGKLPAHDEDGRETSERHRPWELVELHAPELSPKDVASAGQTLRSVVEALVIAEEAGWIGREPIRQVLASLLALLGIDYDPSVAPARAGQEEGGEEMPPEVAAAFEAALRAVG